MNFGYDLDMKKIYVAMSGGVDSSVAAALLQRGGYDVTGVFIKTWYPKWFKCSWQEDRRDAMRVAAHLGIPFKTYDLSREYKKAVVDYMVREYKAGRTPNPDVMCNRHVKFDAFFRRAVRDGADLIATGHYARFKNGRFFTAKDKNKDQTYFLWNVKHSVLDKTLFPIGDYTKPEVRKLAKKFGLVTAGKQESMGLCFMTEITARDFLKHYIKPKKGRVVNDKNKIIGEHDGAFFFTIGQRHGFTITDKTPHDQPYYVVGKDIKKNILFVSQKRDEKKHYTREVVIAHCNWLVDIKKLVASRQKLAARIRYRQPLQKISHLTIHATRYTLHFTRAQRAVTPGQSLVLYSGSQLLGGGIIQKLDS